MSASWQVEGGRLACRWSGLQQYSPYDAPWMREATEARGSYLPPLPNFASHSPFGGPSWLERFVPTGAKGAEDSADEVVSTKNRAQDQ
jgi:hypothetical protein